MRRGIALAVVLALAAVSCSPRIGPAPTIPAEAEEVAVYSALIQTLYVDNERAGQIVIRDQTDVYLAGRSLGGTLSTVQGEHRDVTDEVCTDFQTQNQVPGTLKPTLTISVPYVLMSQSEHETIFQGQGRWTRFHAQYPRAQGLLTLSRVGLSSRHDVALVYVGYGKDWVIGSGGFVVLKKVEGAWTVKGQTGIWIA